LVMYMLPPIIVTDVKRPFTVFSKKGRIMQMHARPCNGLSLCISGQITYTMAGQTYVSRPGTAVLLPQNATYTLHGDSDGLFPVINFSCANPICDQIRLINLDDPGACLADCQALGNLFLFENGQLDIFSAFYALLNKILGGHSRGGSPLSPALRYLEAHLSDPALSNTDLARELGISEVYLRKRFQALYGTTPKQYILELRLRRAMQLLTDTPYTVTAIAELCGFSSLYHFCRAFRSRTGLTPSQYAKSHKLYNI